MALGDKYVNKLPKVFNPNPLDVKEAQDYNIEVRKRIPQTILGQEDLKPQLLQGPGAQMTAAKASAAQVSPDILAKRQELLKGNRDAMSRTFQAQGQMQDDMLKRRFAQLGGGGGGALIKAQLQANQELGTSQADQERSLAGQELAAQSAFEEAQAGREQQAGMLNAQQLQQANQMNTQAAQSRDLFNVELQNKIAEYNQQSELQRAQQLYDIDTTEFNRGIAQLASGGGK